MIHRITLFVAKELYQKVLFPCDDGNPILESAKDSMIRVDMDQNTKPVRIDLFSDYRFFFSINPVHQKNKSCNIYFSESMFNRLISLLVIKFNIVTERQRILEAKGIETNKTIFNL